MNPIILNWGPAAFIVGGYLLGIYFQNKRLEDMRDVLRAEIATVRGEIGIVRAEAKVMETRLEALIERNHSELLGKFADSTAA
jgi:hypothetical protein